jgi:hypothetical protein
MHLKTEPVKTDVAIVSSVMKGSSTQLLNSKPMHDVGEGHFLPCLHKPHHKGIL